MYYVAEQIPGYAYGSPGLAVAQLTANDLADLKTSAGFTAADERYLRLAGAVLTGQTQKIVEHWRSQIIASIPHLAKHSRTPEGTPIPEYLQRSNLRFEQWILDTCLRPYDADWANYQQVIALRHMAPQKNQTDGVRSTPYIPFRDVLAFIAIMNETIKPYLAAKGNSSSEVDGMHRAWCRSLQLQMALWALAYTTTQDGAASEHFIGK